MNMKYSYTIVIGKIVILIICIFIFYPFINKFLNKVLNINNGFVRSNLVEGFTWSKNTINQFNDYQDTVNLNNNQFNMSVLQEQASEDEAKELLKTGYWPWSDDTKKQYIEGIWQNPIIKFQPEAALDYAMKLYNETAAKRLLSWNTKEGKFLLYGGTNNGADNIIGIATDGAPNGLGYGITNAGKTSNNNIIKCSGDPDKDPILQKTTVTGYNLFNGFKVVTTVDIAPENIPNEMPGFSFVNSPCNPCSALNNTPDYNCPFKLNVNGDNETSDVWKGLWSM